MIGRLLLRFLFRVLYFEFLNFLILFEFFILFLRLIDKQLRLLYLFLPKWHEIRIRLFTAL